MPKKRKPTTKRHRFMVPPSFPNDLDQRLQVVWQVVGHLIDWCDSSEAWTQLFCSVARPYRETFYWEAIARMVPEYLAKHPTASPEDALSNCLIATQCSPCVDDRAALKEFHRCGRNSEYLKR